MKKSTLTLFLLLCATLTLWAQTEREYLRINTSDEKIVAYLTKKEVKPQLQSEYYWSVKRELHHSIGGYSGKLVDGTFEIYYLNNQLKTKGDFKLGQKQGLWKTWLESGKLDKLEHWQGGVLTGKSSHFYPSGKLKKEGNYKQNKQSGNWRFYWPSGIIKQQTKFKQGIQHGWHIEYDTLGVEVFRTKFKLGKELEPKIKEEKDWLRFFKKKEKEPETESEILKKKEKAERKAKKAQEREARKQAKVLEKQQNEGDKMLEEDGKEKKKWFKWPFKKKS